MIGDTTLFYCILLISLFQVSLINFAITFSGLEDQLLGVVVVEEMPEMEEKKNSLVISNSRMRKELQELEDTILFMLSNSTGNILDDYKLIETLRSSKIKSAEIIVKVSEAEGTEKTIDENRTSKNWRKSKSTKRKLN